jgi:hypothetical protein
VTLDEAVTLAAALGVPLSDLVKPMPAPSPETEAERAMYRIFTEVVDDEEHANGYAETRALIHKLRMLPPRLRAELAGFEHIAAHKDAVGFMPIGAAGDDAVPVFAPDPRFDR